jgi:1-aminocyclopropane-1-carboxylate deaminase
MLRYQEFPTPIQLLENFNNNAFGVEVYLKRDDLIHPFISGNKWRKLKGYLADAQSHNVSKLVTFGGAFSNHLIATACAGALFGFETKAYIRGDYVDINNPVLTLCRIYGMELLPVTKVEYAKLKNFSSAIKENEYWINEGGYGELGTIGCAEIIDELDGYFNHIVCAVGTGTTVAGLIKGLGNNQINTRIHGIAVLKNASYLNKEIEQLTANSHDNFELHTSYYYGGYGKVDFQITDYIKQFAKHYGVLLDPIYTSKMMLATIELIESGVIKPNQKVLCIHTGGLTGLLSDKMIKKF